MLKAKILKLLAALILLVVVIKFVPPINNIARENLPAPVLKLIGEKPMGVLEKGMNRLNDLVN